MSKLADLKREVRARLTADGQLSDRLDEIEERRKADGVTAEDLAFITTEHAKLASDLFVVTIDTDDGPAVASVPGWGDNANVFADLRAALDVADVLKAEGEASPKVYKLVEFRT